MENRNLFFGIIGLLAVVVIGLGIDRSNQISSLTDQAETAAAQAQEASDNMAATLDAQTANLAAQSAELDSQVAEVEVLSTQMAVSSTAYEEQISELSDVADALEAVNSDFVTQVADLSAQVDIGATQAAIAATAQAEAITQADIAATAQADAELQAYIAATYAVVVATFEAENAMLMAQLEELQPTVPPTPVPTLPPTPAPTTVADMSAPDMTDLDIAVQVDMDNRSVAQISPNGESVAILRGDNVIEFVSAVDGTSQRVLSNIEGEMSDFVFANDGHSIAAVVEDDNLVIFDAATGVVSLEQPARNPLKGYDFAPDNNAIVVGTARDIEITVLDSGRSQTRQGGVTSLDWSADGTHIVAANGRSLSLFAIEDYSISGTTDLPVSLVEVLFSPDGAYIAGTTVNQELVVVSVETGEVAWRSDLEVELVNDIEWSGDSAHLAVVADGDIRIYGVEGSWVVHAMLDGVTSVDWSADGALIAFASSSQVSLVEASTLMN